MVSSGADMRNDEAHSLFLVQFLAETLQAETVQLPEVCQKVALAW